MEIAVNIFAFITGFSVIFGFYLMCKITGKLFDTLREIEKEVKESNDEVRKELDHLKDTLRISNNNIERDANNFSILDTERISKRNKLIIEGVWEIPSFEGMGCDYLKIRIRYTDIDKILKYVDSRNMVCINMSDISTKIEGLGQIQPADAGIDYVTLKIYMAGLAYADTTLKADIVINVNYKNIHTYSIIKEVKE